MKDIFLSIEGVQESDGEEPSKIVLMTGGKLESEQGKITLSYDESETTGMDGTETRVIIEGKRVILAREGAVTTHMVFEEGQNHISLYQTPHGALTVSVFASEVHTALEDEKGDIMVDYALHIDNEQVSRNTFKVQYNLGKISPASKAADSLS